MISDKRLLRCGLHGASTRWKGAGGHPGTRPGLPPSSGAGPAAPRPGGPQAGRQGGSRSLARAARAGSLGRAALGMPQPSQCPRAWPPGLPRGSASSPQGDCPRVGRSEGQSPRTLAVAPCRPDLGRRVQNKPWLPLRRLSHDLSGVGGVGRESSPVGGSRNRAVRPLKDGGTDGPPRARAGSPPASGSPHGAGGAAGSAVAEAVPPEQSWHRMGASVTNSCWPHGHRHRARRPSERGHPVPQSNLSMTPPPDAPATCWGLRGRDTREPPPWGVPSATPRLQDT